MENLQLDFLWERSAPLAEPETIAMIGFAAAIIAVIISVITQTSGFFRFTACTIVPLMFYWGGESKAAIIMAFFMIAIMMSALNGSLGNILYAMFTSIPLKQDFSPQKSVSQLRRANGNLTTKELIMLIERSRPFFESYFNNLNNKITKPIREIIAEKEVRRILGPLSSYLCNNDGYDVDSELRELAVKIQYELCIYAEEHQAEIEDHFRKIDQGLIKPFSYYRAFKDDLPLARDYLAKQIYFKSSKASLKRDENLT
ncbi:hypothetical protein [Candidatus Odyssella thessalonicensis]|uniref:hypothetical protein n=1 Tax=Candidatus Odyssella thessalonicensis TaxID=84647 RepID=UPI0011126433|nr:hypothetical protein [Candidatus Odyssella thessalonicensis]